MHHPSRALLPVLLLALASCAAGQDLQSQLKSLAFGGKAEEAKQLLEAARKDADTASPEWLAAASWVGRAGVFAADWEIAETYATEAYNGSQPLAAEHGVDGEKHLDTAVGASVEVLGQVLDAAADREGAVSFLEKEIAKYSGTSIETRLRKNLLLLDLEGAPMPELEVDDWASAKRMTGQDLKGKVSLFFFWAHWCGTCAREKPVLDTLHDAYAGEAFQIIGPTRLYGYVTRGKDAEPDEELEHIRSAYGRGRAVPDWMAAPVNTQNFLNFGVSTTPTMVLVDQQGVVRMYKPGFVSEEELRERINALLGKDPS